MSKLDEVIHRCDQGFADKRDADILRKFTGDVKTLLEWSHLRDFLGSNAFFDLVELIEENYGESDPSADSV